MRNNTALEEILKYFIVTDGKLSVAGQPLAAYADKTPTPFYIYDLGVAKKKYQKLRNALPSKIDIHYAIKANPHPEIIQFFNFLGTGFDVASAGELSKAVDCGVAPNKIGFAGPGKRPSEIEYACKLGIECLSAESEYELEIANQVAGAFKKKLNIILRINPKYELVGSGMKMGGGANQFGIDQENIPELLHKFNNWNKLNFLGFHIFAGSQNLYEDSICMAFTKAMETIIELIPDCPQYPRYLNLGGGFGIPYYGDDKEIDIKKVGLHIEEELRKVQSRI